MRVILPNESELLNNLKRGDKDAMTIIFQRFWDALYLSAFNVLKDQHLCEDIVQEVFINIWNKRETLQIISLGAYLQASVRYEVYREIKKQGVRAKIIDDFSVYTEQIFLERRLDCKELSSQITTIIEQLPSKCREVYKLSREEQLTHKEIASRLQISTKTVENHLTKALRFLKISMEKALPLLAVSLACFIENNFLRK